MKLTNSPWGKIDIITEVIQGVFFVSTPSHGGFMVSKNIPLSNAAKNRSIPFEGFYCFEEDCQASIVAYELNLKNERISKEDIERSLSFWNSSYLQEIGQAQILHKFPKQENF